jgi:hypothetical protein
VRILDTKCRLNQTILDIPGSNDRNVQFIKLFDAKLLVKIQGENCLWIYDLKNLKARPGSLLFFDEMVWKGGYLQMICLKISGAHYFYDLVAGKLLFTIKLSNPKCYQYSKIRQGKFNCIESKQDEAGGTIFAVTVYDFSLLEEKRNTKPAQTLFSLFKGKFSS